MLISGKIKNMFQGVSQQSPAMRLPTQGERMVNCFPSLVHGLVKRPPTKHITSLDPRFMHCKMYHIKRDANNEYILLLGKNTIGVLDMKGKHKNVIMDARGSYLNTSALTSKTVADHTFIINQEKIVLASEEKAPKKSGLLIYIKQASYQTEYNVRITNKSGKTITEASYMTPANVGTVERPPQKISTQEIAEKLLEKMREDLLVAGLRYHQAHSTIFITDINYDATLTCEAWDSRGNTHITAIHNRVQRFSDLPSYAPKGYSVEVVGDGSNSDNYYLTFMKDNDESSDLPSHAYNTAVAELPSVTTGTTYYADVKAEGLDLSVQYETTKIVASEPRRLYTTKIAKTVANTTYTVAVEVDGKKATASSAIGPKVEFWSAMQFDGVVSMGHYVFNIGDIIKPFTIDYSAGGGVLKFMELLLSHFNSLGLGKFRVWSPDNSRTVIIAAPDMKTLFLTVGTVVHKGKTYAITKPPGNNIATAARTLRTNLDVATEIAESLPTKLSDAGITNIACTQSKETLYIDDKIGGRTVTVACTPTSATTNTYTTSPALIAGIAAETAEDITAILARLLNEKIQSSILTRALLKAAAEGKQLGLYGLKPDVAFTMTLRDSNGNTYPVVYTESSSYTEITQDDDSIGKGVWKESVKPGTRLGLQSHTMPHVLVNIDDTFHFKEAAWSERSVGDENLAPDPIFVGRPLHNMFLFRNRLGFLSDDTLSMSAAGDFMCLYPETVITLMASDPIFLASGHSEVTQLLYSLPYQESLLVFAEQAQFVLSGGDILSGETAELKVATNYRMTRDVSPVNSGRTIFYASGMGEQTDIREYYADANLGLKDATNITSHVPNYIVGNAAKIECSTKEDLLAVLPKNKNLNRLYMYKYYWNGDEKLQAAWFTFELPKGEIKDILFTDSRLYLLVMYEGELVLECMDFSIAPYVRDEPNITYIDRQITLTDGVYKSGITTWDNLPYSLSPYKTESLCIVDTDTHESIPFTRNGETISVAGDLREKNLAFGVRYNAAYTFSQQYARNSNTGEVATYIGKLIYRNWNFIYGESHAFSVDVKHRGGQHYRYHCRNNEAKTGMFQVPIRGASSDVEITVENDTHLPCSIVSVEWEATAVTRSQNV